MSEMLVAGVILSSVSVACLGLGIYTIRSSRKSRKRKKKQTVPEVSEASKPSVDGLQQLCSKLEVLIKEEAEH